MFARASSPYTHGPASVSRTMLRVIYAVLPAAVAATWFFGWGVLINIILATLIALASEAAMLQLRKRPIAPALKDGSATLTAILLGMALPPLAPWWLVLVGVTMAIIFAKHMYGGLGYNPFNPAMVGYVVLLVSFPVEMTQWFAPVALLDSPPGLLASLSYVFSGEFPAAVAGLDSLTMATPLDSLKTDLSLNRTVSEAMAASPVFGILSGKGRDVVNGIILLGGAWMIYKQVIGWQVPLAMLGTLFLIASLFHIINPDIYAGPLFHLFSGGAMLGAFFIATDPVSGATSNRGRLLFGVGVGLFTYIIRTWGGYPDGVAFSVLLMNMAAPTIDYYTRPRVYGEERG